MPRRGVVALACASVAVASVVWLGGQAANSKPLEIYVIDAEGGKAALYVAPSGQAVLVDSGSPGGRDTDRLMLALADAHVAKIDHVISTHYHVDHVGGLQELAQRLPIGDFIDHGPTVETREQVAGFQEMYAGLFAKAKHTVARAGDVVPVAGLDWRIVTAAGRGLTRPLPDVRPMPNAACAGFTPTIQASTWSTPDDDQSVGSVVTLGKFRVIDLGDLLWDHAMDLTCPNNLVGAVDLYMVTGHGAEVCSAPPFLQAIRPRVGIMQNGTRKGGDLVSFQALRAMTGFEDLWQLHWAYKAGIEQNSPAALIANVDEPAAIAGVIAPPPPPPASPTEAGAPARGRGRGNAVPPHTPAYWIKVSAWPDGSFTVSNSRNGFSRTYGPR